MKKSYLHIFSVLVAAVALMSGCRSEIKLDQIDPTIEAQMKVALPIGSMTAKVSDFLGTSDTAELYIDTMNNEGVVTWRRDWDYNAKLPSIDLTNKIASKSFGINLYNKLKSAKYYNTYTQTWESILQPGDKLILPAGQQYSGDIDFRMPLAIDSVNNLIYTVRVDSAQLPVANFNVKINRDNFDDLQWEWIDTIKLDLTSHIKHAPRQIEVLYKKGDPITGYNQPIPLKLSKITLDLMKNSSAPVGKDNVVDTIVFHTYVNYTIPGPLNTQLYPNSGLKCDFNVEKVDVKAVWGWFSDDKGVTYGENINIKYSPYNFLDGARLPLSSPVVNAEVETSAAGNFRLTSDHVYTEDSAGFKHYATWNGDTTMVRVFNESDGCANPITSDLSAITKFSFRLDSTKENGHIDNLMQEMPRKLVYNVGLNFDQASTPQVRIGSNAYVKAHARVRVPIDFHKGVKIAYSDTIKDIKLEQANIDSLLSEVKWIDTMKTTNIHLFVTLYNGIPFKIKGSFYFLDAENKPIMDPENPTERLTLFTPDELTIEGATYDPSSTAQHRVINPASSTTSCELTKARLDLFPKIKAIVYTADVNDECLQDSQYGAQILGRDNLKVKLGLTADLNAYLNLANISTKE